MFSVRIHGSGLRRDEISGVQSLQFGAGRGQAIDASAGAVAYDDIAVRHQSHIAQRTAMRALDAAQQLAAVQVVAKNGGLAPIRFVDDFETLHRDLGGPKSSM